MIQLQLKQGSPEWLSHRSTKRNASDTPSVTGSSTYKSRSSFLKERATGIVQDIDADTQRRFDDGHRFESMARPLMEAIVGEDLYPKVGVYGVWSASFDGLSMLEDINAEHKTLNDAIRACHSAIDLPAMYREQMEHQMMVSGAERSLFMATKWRKAPGDSIEEGKTYAWSSDDDGVLVRYVLEEEKHFWYEPDMELRTMIVSAWEQFEEDVANYQPEVIEAKPILTANPIENLPALVIEVTGRVTHSNLVEFKNAAKAVIGSIKTELIDDQDFVDATNAVKYLKDVSDNAKQAKKAALAQTVSIADLFAALDEVTKMADDVRKALEKKIEEEKAKRKEEIVMAAKAELDKHRHELNERIGGFMPFMLADFTGAIKGLRSIDSMRDKVNTTLANAKIEANATADRIEKNSKSLEADGQNWRFLFPDLHAVVNKQADDFAALLSSRIAKHKEAEAKRIEAIRKDEQAKAEAKVRAEQEAERLEQARKANAEAQAKPATVAEAPKQAEVSEPVQKQQSITKEQIKSVASHVKETANVLHGIMGCLEIMTASEHAEVLAFCESIIEQRSIAA